jgi:hypothetical protein
MATMKEALISKGLTPEAASKFSLYVTNAKAAEAGKDANKRPVSNNDDQQLMALAIKFWNMGILIDGVDAVITGRNMAMVTFNGYKNKVLRTYPETEFDIQLVREGDTFSFSKESGHITYSHKISDPFGTGDGKIIGAYVVFKNKRGEFLEALNRADYEEMKKQSKQTQLWGKWESEFWLKSVIKRAAKRHFYDVVAEIDKNDNDDYGIIAGDPPEPKPDESAKVKEVIAKITDADDLDALRKIVMDSGLMNNKEVIDAYEHMKEMLAEPDVKPVGKQGAAKVTDNPETVNEVEPVKPAETPPTSPTEEPAAAEQGSLIDDKA